MDVHEIKVLMATFTKILSALNKSSHELYVSNREMHNASQVSVLLPYQHSKK